MEIISIAPLRVLRLLVPRYPLRYYPSDTWYSIDIYKGGYAPGSLMLRSRNSGISFRYLQSRRRVTFWYC